MSLGGALTHWAGTGLAPLLPYWLRLRAGRGKEIRHRLEERQGLGAERPEGPLLWLHAASVGESLSLLPLMTALAEQRPALHLLVTTGTVTAATLLAQRLPPDLEDRVIHRFVPLDVPRWAETFLAGWRPDGALFVESELWPNMTAALARRGIPAVLVNARMSPRSARMWQWAPGLAREILSRFRLIFTQTEEDAARLRALGAGHADHWGNLKAAAEPLPADPAELARLRGLIGGRPVFLAASTQPGEEAPVLEAVARLRATLPDLLTIIAPRHPERGTEVAAQATHALATDALAADALAPAPLSDATPGDAAPDNTAPAETGLAETGLAGTGLAETGLAEIRRAGAAPAEAGGATAIRRRAEGGLPDPGCAVYVADTLGELGLFYRLAGVAFIGATLVPKGGHNPLEPARLGCPILFGPHTEHVAEMARALVAAGGALRVTDGATLAEAVADVLSTPGRAQALTRAAATVAADASHLPGKLAAAILEILPIDAGGPPAARGA